MRPTGSSKFGSIFIKVVCACENAHKAGLIFQNDLHMENICLDELSGEYIFVDVENFQSAANSAVFVQGMKTAFKHLTGNQMPAGQAPKFFKETLGWSTLRTRGRTSLPGYFTGGCSQRATLSSAIGCNKRFFGCEAIFFSEFCSRACRTWGASRR